MAIPRLSCSLALHIVVFPAKSGGIQASGFVHVCSGVAFHPLLRANAKRMRCRCVAIHGHIGLGLASTRFYLRSCACRTRLPAGLQFISTAGTGAIFLRASAYEIHGCMAADGRLVLTKRKPPVLRSFRMDLVAAVISPPDKVGEWSVMLKALCYWRGRALQTFSKTA
ncbi:hypothetical protein C2E23DRAFT_849777 [Lenzites betulinus]|nr:hypothetical protein C2E23DRAFT_849777 [Lenzites betulinus]